MTSSDPVNPRSRSSGLQRAAGSRRSRGPTCVFMIVVTLRAYSRIRGLTSLGQRDVQLRAPPPGSARARRRSCTGLRNDHSSETAIASTPSVTSSRTARRTPSSSSGTIDGALVVDALVDLDDRGCAAPAARACGAGHVLDLVGAQPGVAALQVHDADRVGVPAGGQEPDLGHVAGDQRVRAWTWCRARCSRCRRAARATLSPRSPASSSIALRKPCAKSGGVDGVLAAASRSCWSAANASVNVPPVSMPMTYGMDVPPVASVRFMDSVRMTLTALSSV